MAKDRTNEQIVYEAIGENPARIMGGEWKRAANGWEYLRGVQDWPRRGCVTIKPSKDGDALTVFFNHDSGRAGTVTRVIPYIMEREGLTEWEAIRYIADVYGLRLVFSKDQQERITRAQLAREVFPSLREALRENPDGEAARYLRERRKFDTFGDFFGELSPASIERAREVLKLQGKTYTADDWEALGLTEDRAATGYAVVIPYYKRGTIQGLLYRNIRQDAHPKYLINTGAKRGFYCGRLVYGKPAYIVEGEIDAIRLTQAAQHSGGEIQNVIGMGTAKAGDDLAALLRSHGITSVTYIADTQYNANREKRTDLTAAAVRGFRSLTVEGEPVVKSLQIVEFAAPEGVDLNGYKVDADSYGAENGAESLAVAVQFEARDAWAWELDRLTEWEQAHRTASGLAPVGDVQERFADIYTHCGGPFERERVKQAISAGALSCRLAPYGITPDGLNDLDEWDRNRQYYNRVKQAAADLNKAVQEQANPETVGEIARRLYEAQGANTRAEWEAQLSETFADELDAIRAQPDTLATRWEVGQIGRDKQYHRTERVEFWPADITVFCAPTSHGKTAVLFQAAINAVQDNPAKTFIYVSCEESKRQLTERALNVAIDIPTGTADEYHRGKPCFIEGTRKRTIKAIIRNTAPPQEYKTDEIGGPERFDGLRACIKREFQRYADEIRPRLKFVHTEGSAESITENVLYYVQQYRKIGVEVGGVFVDYMQLLTTDARNYSRHDELKDICKALKDCAARTELPVIIAAQLNRNVLRDGLDNITVANIGEGADVERIAHDIFLLWQVDKTPLGLYTKPNQQTGEPELKNGALGFRSKRLFTQTLGHPENVELKHGYLYIEQMKARDGKTEGWGLFPFDGERGRVGSIDTAAMNQ